MKLGKNENMFKKKENNMIFNRLPHVVTHSCIYFGNDRQHERYFRESKSFLKATKSTRRKMFLKNHKIILFLRHL